jgi:hypothetical protein
MMYHFRSRLSGRGCAALPQEIMAGPELGLISFVAVFSCVLIALGLVGACIRCACLSRRTPLPRYAAPAAPALIEHPAGEQSLGLPLSPWR